MTDSPLSFLTPAQMQESLQEIVAKKITTPVSKVFLLAIFAGVFIAFGGLFCTVAGTDPLKILPYGLVRILMGFVFCVGLILVIVGGAELFTGNTMLAVLDMRKKENVKKIVKNWSLVYLGNFLGSIFIAAMVVWGGVYLFGNGAVGKTAISIAITKTNYSFMQAFVLGILCNMLVCLAIWLTLSARSTTGKILAILFPISAFVAIGFEHSVANMYLIPVGLFIKSSAPAFVHSTKLVATNLTWWNFLVNNLLPVTLGNIVGGILIWLPYNYIYRKN